MNDTSLAGRGKCASLLVPMQSLLTPQGESGGSLITAGE